MKILEVIAHSAHADTVSAIAEKLDVDDLRFGIPDDDDIQSMRLLVHNADVQPALDSLQNLLNSQPDARILVIPVETVLPRPSESERKETEAKTAARETLYDNITQNARLDQNFFLLVILSTVVAAIGLLENNVAVLIGAMVIAPLLGPNLALGLGTALGDSELIRRSLISIVSGIGVAIALSYGIGWLWPTDVISTELLARTTAGPDTIVLALASGAAAALSITTGLPSVLVGVMVAVALLPPAAAIGLMLGQHHLELAAGAGLQLAINIVCVNLSCKLVFYIKGVQPRTWLEKKKATRGMRVYLVVWLITLTLLAVIIAKGGLRAFEF